MNVTEINIEDIKEYKNNPRIISNHAIKQVAKSIAHFGFKVPVIIDKHNTLISGHTRVKAALELGYTAVPCIRAEMLSEQQVNEFRIIDNRLAEMSAWDYFALEQELANIGIDLSEFGLHNVDDIDVDAVFSQKYDTKKEDIICPFCGMEIPYEDS